MSIPTDYFDEQLSGLDSARTIFVGDLSYFCNEEDLFTLFAQFGNILTVRVRRGVTGESLMHGFIAMETTEAATMAISTLDGVEFMGRNIRVQLSSDGQRNSINKDSLVQVHVSFISKQNAFLVTEKILRDIFGPYGAVADVAIKKHVAVPKQGRQSGYGFVYYYDINSAYRALQALKQNTVRDITLDCSISHKSETRIRQTHTPANNNLPAAPVFDRAQGLIPYPGQAPAVPMTAGAASPPGASSPYRADMNMNLPASSLYNTTSNMNRVPAVSGAAGTTNGYGTGNQGRAINTGGIPGGMSSTYPRDHAMSATFTTANTTAGGGRRPVIETRQHPMAAVYNPSGTSYNNINVNRLTGHNNTMPVNNLSSDFSRLHMSHNSNNADPRLLSMAATSLTGGMGGPRHTLSSAARHSASTSPRADTFGLTSHDVSPRSVSPRAGNDFLPNDMGTGMLLHQTNLTRHMPVNYPPSGAMLHNDNMSFRTDSLSEYESFSRSRSRSPRAGSPPSSNNHFHHNGNNSFDLTSLRHFETHATTTSGLNLGGLQSLDANNMHQKYNDNVHFMGEMSNNNQKQSRSGSDHDGMFLLDNSNNNNVAAFPSLVPAQSPSSFPNYPVNTIPNIIVNAQPSTASTTESLSRHSVDSLVSSSSPPTSTASLLQDGSIRQFLLSEEAIPDVGNNKQQQEQAQNAIFALDENNDKLLRSLIDNNETLNE